MIMVCMCGGCLCRLCCSQDNKDTLREDLDKKLKRATERKEAAASMQRMSHIPNPVQAAADMRPGPSTEQRFGLPQASTGANSPLHTVSPRQSNLLHSHATLHESAPAAQPQPAAAARQQRQGQQRAPARRAMGEI